MANFILKLYSFCDLFKFELRLGEPSNKVGNLFGINGETIYLCKQI